MKKSNTQSSLEKTKVHHGPYILNIKSVALLMNQKVTSVVFQAVGQQALPPLIINKKQKLETTILQQVGFSITLTVDYKNSDKQLDPIWFKLNEIEALEWMPAGPDKPNGFDYSDSSWTDYDVFPNVFKFDDDEMKFEAHILLISDQPDKNGQSFQEIILVGTIPILGDEDDDN